MTLALQDLKLKMCPFCLVDPFLRRMAYDIGSETASELAKGEVTHKFQTKVYMQCHCVIQPSYCLTIQ